MSKQQAILDFITNFIHSQGYAPTVREIGSAVQLRSTSTVHQHLAQLEKKGYIKRLYSSARAIEVLGVSSASEDIRVVERSEGLPSVIQWQGRRYVLESMG